MVGFASRLCICLVLLVAGQSRAQEGPLLDNETAPLDLRPMMARPATPAPKNSVPPKPKPPIKKEQAAPVAMAIETVAARPNEATGALKNKPADKAAEVQAPAPTETRPPFDEFVLAKYCANLSAAASDGRLAWQAKRMEEVEAQLLSRIGELEKKRSETESWLKRREEALRKADESVVAIYSKMKPDAAAAQFSSMDESGAAAILMKLNPRMASTVLNEIDPSRAARIAAEMAGVGPSQTQARVSP